MDYKRYYEFFGGWTSGEVENEATVTEEQKFQFIKARLLDEVVGEIETHTDVENRSGMMMVSDSKQVVIFKDKP